MITTFLKWIIFFISCDYTTRKILPSNKSSLKKDLIKTCLLTAIILVYKFLFPDEYLALPYALYVIVEVFSSPNVKNAISLSTITFSINQIIMSVSSVIIAFALSLCRGYFSDYPRALAIISTSILHFSLILLLFHSKRLKFGMPFLKSSKLLNIGFIVSILIFVALIVDILFSPAHHKYVVLSQLLICLLFIPLIIWWRHKIKESYLAYLREFELTQLHQQINDLSADNERLSRIVHKDNKLVSAMASSVLTLLEKAPEYDREEFLAQCDSLHKELSELSLHRQELLVSTTAEVSPLGNSHKLVESVLSYEVKNARHSGICTKYNIDNNFMAAIETYLTDEELAHILADMIQNAIIAMKATAQQNLLIHLHMINGNPTISVMDSGTEFSPKVLQNLGLAPCSTHLNEGGSGIGLMDIWQLKIKSKASLVIKELPQPDDYTKQLSIIFDGKNKYVVFTNRKQELTKMINRFDMYIENI